MIEIEFEIVSSGVESNLFDLRKKLERRNCCSVKFSDKFLKFSKGWHFQFC